MAASAVDLGAPGRDIYFGDGRIDAYQALLTALAYNTQSHSSAATAHNNGRRLARDGSGNYHLVFASEGEIFYRKSIGGTTWQSPQRLSSGNGGNNYPCISEHAGKVYATWQRQSGSSYDIYFAASLDGGATWPNRYVLATTQLSTDPLPVIQASATNQNNLMVVFRDGRNGLQGLTSLFTTNSNPSPANWGQAHVPGTDSNSLRPTLTGSKAISQSNTIMELAYQTTAGIIYYQYYIPFGGGWSSRVNLSAIVPGSATHQTPSISGIPNNSPLHVAWHRTTGPGLYDNVIIHRRATSYGAFTSEYFMTYYQAQSQPSITGFAFDKADMLFRYGFQGGSANIAKQHFSSSGWGALSDLGPGSYPSVSQGNSNAKYVYTSGSSSPYTVSLSSETLMKITEEIEPEYSRSIAWLDSSGAYLQVRAEPFQIKLPNGEEQRWDFIPVSLDTFNLTPTNSWELLASLPALLPANAESLIVEIAIDGENLERIANQPGVIARGAFRLIGRNNQVLATRFSPPFNLSGNLPASRHRLSFALNQIGIPPNASAVKANVMVVTGTNPSPGVFASLGHIFDFNGQVSPLMAKSGNSQTRIAPEPEQEENEPQTFMLESNYPNPFNPSTIIRYRLAKEARVSLIVYNLIGQKVRTLADGFIASGSHQMIWDSRNDNGDMVGSGIYFLKIMAESGESRFVGTRKLMLMK